MNDIRVPEIALGTYKHYKGGLYQVLGVALHSETLEPLVLYQHDGKFWVRPYAMFLESVEVDGKAVPRFKFQSSTP